MEVCDIFINKALICLTMFFPLQPCRHHISSGNLSMYVLMIWEMEKKNPYAY